jgi:hypothetical protein
MSEAPEDDEVENSAPTIARKAIHFMVALARQSALPANQ